MSQSPLKSEKGYYMFINRGFHLKKAKLVEQLPSLDKIVQVTSGENTYKRNIGVPIEITN